jgi:hypothetical protein
MNNESLGKDELKVMLIEHLRENPQTQYESIVQSGIQGRIGRSLNSNESQLLLELIHELITSNILMTAMNRLNTGWPWLSVTTHGQEVLSDAGPPVYDYDGYLSELRERVSNLDSVVEKYLSESLRAYQSNLYYASMVMLGCSSERAINLLMKAYVESIDDDTNKEKLRGRINRRDISTAYEKFKQSFDATRNQISEESAVRDFDAHVDGVFTFIRLLRNSIVHPEALPNITSPMVYSNLQQFSYYIATVFWLIEYYETNTTVV